VKICPVKIERVGNRIEGNASTSLANAFKIERKCFHLTGQCIEGNASLGLRSILGR
jgi:hypothetical protein